MEAADLAVENGRIVARAPSLSPAPDDEVVSLEGHYVLPGLVDAHHLPHALLRRGLPLGKAKPSSFVDGLRQGLWRLEEALDGDALSASAAQSALEALSCGTTTVLSQHASPAAIPGSLQRVVEGFSTVGVRAAVSYAITCRHGAERRLQALEETLTFANRAPARYAVRLGASASFTLTPEGLRELSVVNAERKLGVHLVLAEDAADGRLTQEQFGVPFVQRLEEAGLLGPQTTVAHAVHLGWPELARVLGTGAWFVHCPRANANEMRGFAPTGRFGARATLGSAMLGSDMFAEAQAAALRAREAEQPIDVLRYLANGHRIASVVFGLPIGQLQEGAAADLVVTDYQPITPLTAETLAGHVTEAMGARYVHSVMVDGHWRLRERCPTSVSRATLAERAREAAVCVSARMAETRPE